MYKWQSIVSSRRRTAEEAVAVIESGQRVFLSGNCAVPQVVLQALVERALELHDIQIVQVLTIGNSDYVSPEIADHLRVNSLFISANIREAVNEGRADFTPISIKIRKGKPSAER